MSIWKDTPTACINDANQHPCCTQQRRDAKLTPFEIHLQKLFSTMSYGPVLEERYAGDLIGILEYNTQYMSDTVPYRDLSYSLVHLAVPYGGRQDARLEPKVHTEKDPFPRYTYTQ
jgi:hypothetical protein